MDRKRLRKRENFLRTGNRKKLLARKKSSTEGEKPGRLAPPPTQGEKGKGKINARLGTTLNGRGEEEGAATRLPYREGKEKKQSGPSVTPGKKVNKGGFFHRGGKREREVSGVRENCNPASTARRGTKGGVLRGRKKKKNSPAQKEGREVAFKGEKKDLRPSGSVSVQRPAARKKR